MKHEPGIMVGNRFRLRERIAVDAFGELWRAADRVPGKDTTIQFVSFSDASEAFEEEMNHAARLRHRALPRIYEVDREDDGVMRVVSEFVSGESLETILAREGPLPPIVALNLIAELASALTELHHQGLAHGMVSARSVLIARSRFDAMRPKLIAFGRARLLASRPRVHRASEAATMSPEQIATRRFTAATDVWALGVLLFQCVFGRLPFAARTPMSLCAETRLVHRVFDAIEDDALRGIIEQCLALAPEARPPTSVLIRQIELASSIVQNAPQPAPLVVEPIVQPLAQPTDFTPVALVIPPAPSAELAMPLELRPRRSAAAAAAVGAVAVAVIALGLLIAAREMRHESVAAPAETIGTVPLGAMASAAVVP